MSNKKPRYKGVDPESDIRAILQMKYKEAGSLRKLIEQENFQHLNIGDLSDFLNGKRFPKEKNKRTELMALRESFVERMARTGRGDVLSLYAWMLYVKLTKILPAFEGLGKASREATETATQLHATLEACNKFEEK